MSRNESDDVAFFNGSRTSRVQRPSRLLRDHWAIENSEHAVLDVVVAENRSTMAFTQHPKPPERAIAAPSMHHSFQCGCLQWGCRQGANSWRV